MKFLAPLPRTARDYFAQLVADKRHPHQNVLLSLAEKIDTSFENLQQIGPEIPFLPLFALSTAEIASLRHTYQGGTETLRELKADLKTAAGDHDLCCYCQMDGRSAYDHVLPLDAWPEYASISINLVPICTTCNSKKGDASFADDGARLFLNAHRDMVDPGWRWLTANASLANTKPSLSFVLTPPATMDTRLANVLRRQFTRLELLKRYKHRTGYVLAEFRAQYWGERVDHVRKKAANLRDEFGQNYYKAAAFEALALAGYGMTQ